MRYRVADLVLDLRKYEVRKGEVLLPAEPQVLAVLFLLVENRDRLVTKDELVEAVWGGRAIGDSAISSRVKSARQLIGDDGKTQRLIRTVHGKGFRFVGEVVPCHGAEPAAPIPRWEATKPSIAILPFRCADPELSIIADGVPDELIVGLSRLRFLTVIARGSSFRLRDWDKSIDTVTEVLRVHYCLTGTVHRAGHRLVIAVELLDLASGSVIWGEVYEGSADRLQEVRGSILTRIISALELQISFHEAELARGQPLEDLTAWSSYHLGLQHAFRFNAADNARALQHFENAVRLQPGFTRAHAGLSFVRFQNAFMHYSSDISAEVTAARRAADLAIELDELDPAANLMMGRSLWLQGDVASSVPWLDRSLALRPSYAHALYARAWSHMILCEGEEGGKQSRLAIQQSPIDPLRYAMLAIDGFTHAMLGKEEEGAALADRAAREPRAHALIALMAAICQSWAGKDKEARDWAKVARSRSPGVTTEDFLRSFPFMDSKVRSRVSEALSEAMR